MSQDTWEDTENYLDEQKRVAIERAAAVATIKLIAKPGTVSAYDARDLARALITLGIVK